AGPPSSITSRTSPRVSWRWGSALDDRDDAADGREDVPDAHALGLGADLDDGLAGVVDLPGDLPALRLAARDRLLELLHDLLEGVTLAVVQDGHPGGRDLGPRPGDLLDVGRRERPLRHAPDSTAAHPPPSAARGRSGTS